MATPVQTLPFHILVLGNFTGRTQSERNGKLRPILVDRDNLDDVIARLGVTCELPSASDEGAVELLRIGQMADFHPDRLVHRFGYLLKLMELRHNLLDVATFEKASQEVRALANSNQHQNQQATQPKAPSKPEPPRDNIPPTPVSTGNLLDLAISQTGQQGGPSGAAPALPSGLQEAISRSVAPFRIPELPDQASLVAIVDQLASALVAELLHQPSFQQLEGLWRGVDMLVRGLPTSPTLKVFICDLSWDGLIAELRTSDRLDQNDVYRMLVGETVQMPGGIPWSVIVGDYTIQPDMVSLLIAACTARLASQASAPFIMGVDPRLSKADIFANTEERPEWSEPVDPEVLAQWESIRGLAEAKHLGLAAPRVLGRVPYGKDTRPIERFDLQEETDPSDHRAKLWINPAFHCAYALGQSFAASTWETRRQLASSVDGLPFYVYEDRYGEHIHPCTEVPLTDRDSSIMSSNGIIPVAWVKGANEIQIGAWPSIEGAFLRGRWNADS